jgi:metabolite-proton symporter
MVDTTAGSPVDETEQRKQVRRAVIASTVGTSIEWYDFFLYGTAAALVFPKLFFPHSSVYAGTLESFATFFVGFAARPLGAWIFGHYGDRIGRKATLIITLLLMGIATCLIGVLPTYSAIGLWAAVLLIVLRICQGIGVGGEWGGSVLMSMEWHRGNRRGFIASWPQAGVPIGLALSIGAVRLVSELTGDNFATWGWRIPFLFSAVLILVGLFIRLRVLETPLFTRVLEQQEVAKAPVPEAVKHHWPEIALSAFARLAEQAPFYIFTVYVLTYGTKELGLQRNFLLNAVLLAAIISLFTTPFFGYLSDVIGRRRMYIIGALTILVFAFPYFGLLNTKMSALVVLAVVLSIVAHDMMYGPQAAFIAESFPTRLRYSGASLGYQLASVITGGPAPLIAAWLLHTFNSGYAISAYMAVTAVVSAIAAAMLGAKARADLVDSEVRTSQRPAVHADREPAYSGSAYRGST